MRHEFSGKREELKRNEEAAAWLQELKEDDAHVYERYAEWLTASPHNVQAFLRVSMIDASLTKVDPDRSLTIEPVLGGRDTTTVVSLDEPTDPRTSDVLRRRYRPWGIAAGVAAASLAIAGIWIGQISKEWTPYTTAIGEQRTIALKDGSLLQINTNSRVEVRYSTDARTVRLIDGEVLFRVQKEATRPFRVYSGNVAIQAIGTEFNVLRKASGSTVSVIEGRVKVKESLYLNAGEEARVTDDGQVTASGKANLARVDGWRQRRLVFVNETLGAMAAEFERYNGTLRIIVEAPAGDLRTYSAMSFAVDDVESFITVLERDPHLHVERTPGRVVVRSREN